MYMHTYINTSTNAYMHAYVCIQMLHTYVRTCNIHIYIHICIGIYCMYIYMDM